MCQRGAARRRGSHSCRNRNRRPALADSISEPAILASEAGGGGGGGPELTSTVPIAYPSRRAPRGQRVGGSCCTRENLPASVGGDRAQVLVDGNIGGVGDGPAQGSGLAALDASRLSRETVDPDGETAWPRSSGGVVSGGSRRGRRRRSYRNLLLASHDREQQYCANAAAHSIRDFMFIGCAFPFSS